ncbi:alpha-hydroxy acid oxidase [Thermoleophilum album]|nr:alpha-hydroxy acid oxidase [Thermoleophilum album]
MSGQMGSEERDGRRQRASTPQQPPLPATLAEFAELARERLDPGTFGYYAGGAGAEITLRDNEAAWARLRLRPRMLVDVSRRDTSTTFLGQRLAHPICVAPTAFHRLAHPDGEKATAAGAARAQAPLCLSTLATARPSEIAEAAPEATRWFQVYVFRDRGVTRALCEEAAASGFSALFLTVDVPYFGRRERDLRTGFALPALEVPSLAAAVGESDARLDMRAIGELLDASLTWRDLEELVGTSDLPVVVKGVLTAEDARRAIASGAAAVVVSNHGGRQLDGVRAAADALPEVVEEVGEEVDVLVDGGIRRGTDVLKALALGARAVLVGRPVLWGLAVAGAAGVERVLRLLIDEFDLSLALCGVPRACDLGTSVLERSLHGPSAVGRESGTF